MKAKTKGNGGVQSQARDPSVRPKINPKASARMTGSGMKKGMGGMTSRSKCK